MPTQNTSSSDPKSATCPICCEPINPAAKRCNACGTRLDRSDLVERFSGASTILAVLTALISVVTVGLPSLVESLSPDGSQINVAFVRTGNDYPPPYAFDYQIYVSNSGNRPGALGKVWVTSDDSKSKELIELEMPEHYWPKDAEAIRKLEILAPGESQNLYFSRRQARSKVPDKAIIVVNVIEFGGTTKRHKLPIPTNNGDGREPR